MFFILDTLCSSTKMLWEIKSLAVYGMLFSLNQLKNAPSNFSLIFEIFSKLITTVFIVLVVLNLPEFPDSSIIYLIGLGYFDNMISFVFFKNR